MDGGSVPTVHVTVALGSRTLEIGDWIAEFSEECMLLRLSTKLLTELGPILTLDLPRAGQRFERDQPMGWVEGVFGVSDLRAPCACVITEAHASDSDWIVALTIHLPSRTEEPQQVLQF